MDLKAICMIAGIASRKTENGIEVLNKGKKMGTFVEIEDGRSTRLIYPKGSEYKHTSMFNVKLTDQLITDYMTRIAIGEIEEDLRKRR